VPSPVSVTGALAIRTMHRDAASSAVGCMQDPAIRPSNQLQKVESIGFCLEQFTGRHRRPRSRRASLPTAAGAADDIIISSDADIIYFCSTWPSAPMLAITIICAALRKGRPLRQSSVDTLPIGISSTWARLRRRPIFVCETQSYWFYSLFGGRTIY